MKKWFEWKSGRRILSLALSIVMVLSLLPAGALAEEGEITPPSCSCEVLCAETVNHNCPVCDTEGGQCAGVQQQEPEQKQEQQPEQEQESEQEPKTETCAHGNDPDTCEACASESRVADVQALINSLPEDVTDETKAAAQSALADVDAAKSALTEEELGQLNMTRYTALNTKLAALERPAPDPTEEISENALKIITAWAWIDEEEYLDEETGGLALSGTNEERIAFFEDVLAFLPYEITATVDGVEEILTIDWGCEDYPEEGAYEGEYLFTALLPEGYALDEGVKALTVPVLLGGGRTYGEDSGDFLNYHRSADRKTVTSTVIVEANYFSEHSHHTVTDKEYHYISSELTIPKDITVTVSRGVKVHNYSTLHVYGTLIINPGATFTNYPRSTIVSKLDGCLIIHAGGQVIVNGTFDNSSMQDYETKKYYYGHVKIEGGTLTVSGSGSFSGSAPTMDVTYLDSAGNQQTAKDAKLLAPYCIPSPPMSGWYVVEGDVTASAGLYGYSAINLILKNGCKLTASQGITSTNALTIYAQSTGEDMGQLHASSSGTNAAIGGSGGNSGILTINGGQITATSTGTGAGIGGYAGNNGGTITINGGNITAQGGTGSAGIGGGSGSGTIGGYITINGGTVVANGGDETSAGIGAAANGYGGVIIIGDSADVTGTIGKGTTGYSGIVFNKSNTATISQSQNMPINFTIPSGRTLVVEEGATFVIDSGVTASIGGTLTANGNVYVNGSVTGIGNLENNVYFQLNLTGASSDQSVKYEGQTYAKYNTSVTLNPAPPAGQMLSSWTSSDVTVTNNKFTMPKKAVTIQANYEDIVATVTMNGANTDYYSIDTALNAAKAATSTVTLRQNCSLGSAVDITGNCTLKAESYTLTISAGKSLNVKSGGNLTLNSGTVSGAVNTEGTLTIDGATASSVTVQGGTLTVKRGSASSVTAHGGNVNVTGGTVETLSVPTASGVSVQLSGGTFKSITGSMPLSNMLADGFAFHQESNPMVLVADQTSLSSDVTVKSHTHSWVEHTYQSESKHAVTCEYCRKTAAQDHGLSESNIICACGATRYLQGGAIHVAKCQPLAADTTTLTGTNPTGGWYVATGEYNFSSRVTVTGTVHLVLADGCELKADSGIEVSGSNTLNIYAQSTGSPGRLTATNTDAAAIGSNSNSDSGSVIIHGGHISATSYMGAGIGGGGGTNNSGRGGGAVTIYGGTVDASGTFGAGIGGGASLYGTGGSGASVTVHGGNVTATSSFAAGIGSGYGKTASTNGGSTSVLGGTVTAVGTEAFTRAPSTDATGRYKTSAGDSISALSAVSHTNLNEAIYTGSKAARMEPCSSHHIEQRYYVDADTHEGDCIWCGLITEPHSYGSDGKCTCLRHAASVTIGETTTKYLSIEEAVAAATGKTAVITLLSDVTAAETIDFGTSGDVTFIGGDYTFTGDITAAADCLHITSGSFHGKLLNSQTGSVYKLLGEGCAIKRVNGSWVSPADASTSLSDQFRVVKAPISIASLPETEAITYGQDKSLSCSVDNDGGTDEPSYQWYVSTTPLDGETRSTLSLSGLNAGDHSIRCKVTYAGYSAYSSSCKVTVSKATGSITISDPGKVYDGTAVSMEGKYTTVPSNAQVTSEFKKQTENTYSSTAPIYAGNYTVRATMRETANVALKTETKNFTISPAEQTVTAQKVTAAFGQTVDLTGFLTAENGDAAQATFEIAPGSDALGCTISSNNLVTGSIKGEITVNYSVPGRDVNGDGTPEYATKTGTMTVSITDCVIHLEVPEAGYTYDGSPKKPTVSVKVGQTVVPAGEYSVTYTDNVNAGSAKVTVTGKEGSTYTVAGEETFTISPRTIEIAWASTTLTYNGSEQAPAATVSNSIAGDDIALTVSGQQKNANTEANPSYTATVTEVIGADAGNYTLPVEKTQAFTIIPKEITTVITPNGGIFSGTITAASCETAGVISGEDDPVILIYIGTANDGSKVNGADVPTQAGTYTVTATVSNGNYKLSQNVSCIFSITKAAPTFTAPAGKAAVYDGTKLALAEAGTAQGGTMQYRLGEDGEWSTTIPTATECGTYTVYYKVMGDQNHNSSEAQSVTAQIVPFQIKSQTGTVEIDYGKNAEVSVTLDTVLSEGISYQWYLVTDKGDVELTGETNRTLTLTKPNAGEYAYVCKITCGNYTRYSENTTVTVTPGTISVDTGEDADLSGFWLEGGEAPASAGQADIPERSPSSRLLTQYTEEKNTQGDAYPSGMKVYKLDENNKPVEIVDLGNLLRYSGCSIRITGKPGIRMITSLTKEAKTALTKANLAGYTLEEYGTVVQWSDDLHGASLTLANGNHNYAYKKGVSDPVFANVGELTQYTNVLVWDELEDAKYVEDIVMRPYIILSKGGETVTLYGGTVNRSIGYVAQQNADTFPVGSAGYNYVHEIINKVKNLSNNSQQS